MVRKLGFLTISFFLISLWPALAFSQDPGIPDTARVECLKLVRPNSQVILNVYVVNDSALGGFSIPLAFPDTVTHLDIICDSISFVGTRAADAPSKSDSLSIHNDKNRLVVFAVWFTGNLSPGSGSVAKIYFSTGPTWDSTEYISVDTIRFPTQDTAIFVTLEFTNAQGVAYLPAFVKGCLGAEIVTADFLGNPTAGYSPLSVQFTDLSTGAPTSWYWDFGDGFTDTLQNPQHTYNDTGCFDVELIVSNSASTDTLVKSQYICVFETLTVDFTAQPTQGRLHLSVTFQSLCNPPTDSLTWYFGDGDSSKLLNPVHEYDDYGNFDVKLVAQLFGYRDSLIKEDYIQVIDTLKYTVYSPVDIIVTDPAGDSISVDTNTIPGASYDTLLDVNQDGETDDVVTILNPLTGDYTIKVVAESGSIGGSYTLAVKLDGNEDTPMVTAAPAPQPGEVDTVFYTITGYLRGDPNSDGVKNVSDVIFLINYLFKGGLPPVPLILGDLNCDNQVNISDVIYLINYLYRGGPAPCS